MHPSCLAGSCPWASPSEEPWACCCQLGTCWAVALAAALLEPQWEVVVEGPGTVDPGLVLTFTIVASAAVEQLAATEPSASSPELVAALACSRKGAG